MGLFDKLFRSNDAEDKGLNLTKTSQPLNEDLYWQIVQDSLDKTTNQDDQEQYLVERIQRLSATDIIGFRLRTDKLLYDTYTSEIWCAAYLMNGGCSDDGFEYFRCWLISKGKDIYFKAKAHADSLINVMDDETEDYEFESFWYVALTAFENKTGQVLYDYIDESFSYNGSDYQPIELTWEEDEPETMRAICPAIFNKMMG